MIEVSNGPNFGRTCVALSDPISGIPYRRGYLLYGPPGSGKTSFIQALAVCEHMCGRQLDTDIMIGRT